MKKFFSKDNFVFCSLEQKEKRISLCLSCVMMLAFVLSCFTFFNSIYVISDCVGSIVCASIDVSLKDLLRSLPIFLTCFMSIWTLLLCHAFFRNVSEERRNKSLFKNSIVILEYKGGKNKEFFTAEMPSVKQIEDNWAQEKEQLNCKRIK